MKGLSKAVPFMPLGATKLPGKPMAQEGAAERFRQLQQVYNGAPEQYQKRHAETYRQALDKLEALYAQYPPASPEVVEAHRRLGYPEHYVHSLETGNYKFITEPTVRPDGTKDWRSFEQYWSFDSAMSSNITAQRGFDKIRAHLQREHAHGKGISFVPRVDLGALYAATANIPDVADNVRWFVDQRSQGELKLSPQVVEDAWSSYTSSNEGQVADSIMDLVKEKDIEVRYARRMALVQWMQARGDIDHWDLMDMMPRQRDEAIARDDESGDYLIRYVLPEVEDAAATQIPSWTDFKDLLRAQRSEWDEKDEHAAMGGAVTEAAELQRRIDQILQRDSAGSGEGGAADKGEKKRNLSVEIVMNQEKMEKDAASRMSTNADRLPYIAQGMLRYMLGEDYKTRWADLHKKAMDKAAAQAAH